MPAHLVALFAPRPPLKFVTPQDVSPEKRQTPFITGVAEYLKNLNTPDESYVYSESWLEKQQRLKQQKAAEHQKNLEESTKSWDPFHDPHARGDPYKTLFIARLSYDVEESDIEQEFVRFGPIERIRVVRTPDGKSRGYAFVVFERERDLKSAFKEANGIIIKGRSILLDVERGRTVKGWKPRRIGGGKGGRHYTKINLLRNASKFSRRPNGDGYKSRREQNGNRVDSSSFSRIPPYKREDNRGEGRRSRDYNRDSPRYDRYDNKRRDGGSRQSGREFMRDKSPSRHDDRSGRSYRDRDYRERQSGSSSHSSGYSRPAPNYHPPPPYREYHKENRDDVSSHY